MTQLELWNRACAFLGITQPIDSVNSTLNHALLCSQFEATALQCVLEEWQWSFATAQSELVQDCQEVALTAFVLMVDEDDNQYASIQTSDNVGLDDGDVVIINGTCNGVVYDDAEFHVQYVGALTEFVDEEEPPPP